MSRLVLLAVADSHSRRYKCPRPLTGKTIAVRILTTLAVLEGGRVAVAGHDVVTEAVAVRRSIGVTAQDATVDEMPAAELLTDRQRFLWNMDPRPAQKIMGKPIDPEGDISYRLSMDQISTLAARLHVDLRRQASAVCPGACAGGRPATGQLLPVAR